MDIKKQYLKNSNNRGVLLVITALVLPTFIAMLGLAIDFGSLYVQRNRLQDVADAAALAGASKFSGETQSAPLSSDSVVGKAITETVKINDDSFSNIVLTANSSTVKKHVVPLYEPNNTSEIKNVIENIWKKAPGITKNSSVLLEYSISGAIIDNESINEEDKLSTFATNVDRVRVRLTKKNICLFPQGIIS